MTQKQTIPALLLTGLLVVSAAFIHPSSVAAAGFSEFGLNKRVLRKACKNKAIKPSLSLYKRLLAKCAQKSLRRRIRKLQDNPTKLIELELTIARIDQFVEALNQEEAEKGKKATANFGGTWETNFGDTTFAQFDDGSVSGTWTVQGGGTLSGQVVGRTLSGTWRSEGGSGSFSITMKGKKKNKRWSGTCEGPWSGTRK